MAFSETHKRWVSDAVLWFCEGDLPGLNIFTLSSTQAFLCFLSQTADATTFRQIWRTQRWGGTVRIRWALQKNLLQQLECSYHIGCFVWPLSTPFLKQMAGERGQMKSVRKIIFTNCKNNFQTLLLRAEAVSSHWVATCPSNPFFIPFASVASMDPALDLQSSTLLPHATAVPIFWATKNGNVSK